MDQAQIGRQQIDFLEIDLVGLRKCRDDLLDSQPLKDAKISGCLHLTAQTAVLIETLQKLGAQVQ